MKCHAIQSSVKKQIWDSRDGKATSSPGSQGWFLEMSKDREVLLINKGREKNP